MFLKTTREELLKKQAADLAEFDREAAIATKFPGSPTAVHSWAHGCPWATYEVPNLATGVELLRSFNAEYVPAAVVRAGCTTIDAVEALKDEYLKQRDEKGADFEFSGPYVACERIPRCSPSAQINAFIRLANGEVGRVTVKHPILSSAPLPLAIRSTVRYNSHGDVTEASHELPSVGEDYRVKYGTGSRDAAHIVLLFKTPEKFFETVGAAVKGGAR